MRWALFIGLAGCTEVGGGDGRARVYFDCVCDSSSETALYYFEGDYENSYCEPKSSGVVADQAVQDCEGYLYGGGYYDNVCDCTCTRSSDAC